MLQCITNLFVLHIFFILVHIFMTLLIQQTGSNSLQRGCIPTSHEQVMSNYPLVSLKNIVTGTLAGSSLIYILIGNSITICLNYIFF